MKVKFWLKLKWRPLGFDRWWEQWEWHLKPSNFDPWPSFTEISWKFTLVSCVVLHVPNPPEYTPLQTFIIKPAQHVREPRCAEPQNPRHVLGARWWLMHGRDHWARHFSIVMVYLQVKIKIAVGLCTRRCESMNKDFRSILEPVFTQDQSSEPVNISHIVFYLIFSLPPLLFSSLSTLSHHLSYHSISSPEGPVFAKRPCLWQGLALPLLALLYFCLSRLFPLSSYFYLFPAFISLTPGSGGLSCPSNTNWSPRTKENRRR